MSKILTTLIVYTPDKRSGSALCRLLKLKLEHLLTMYLQNTEAVIEEIRYGTDGIIIMDFSSISSMENIIEDIEEVVSLADNLPIIMLTNYSVDEEEIANFQERGFHILQKPICLETLISLIGELSEK